jgi:hypothetical protein
MTAPDITSQLIGRERRPLALIDDFAPNPGQLRKAAMASVFGPAANHYPGIRAPLPPNYFPTQMSIIATVLRDHFGEARTACLIDASFSMVTTPVDTLSVAQRLPHADAFDPNRIALVHYLSLEDDGGTAFYRHRSTGFETINAARAPIYFGQVDAELRRALPPPGYIDDDTSLFERIEQVEARYNRALIYRSMNLHSGAIAPGAALSPDPAVGRLTVTAFFELQ